MGYNCNNKERQFGDVESNLVIIAFCLVDFITHSEENGRKHYQLRRSCDTPFLVLSDHLNLEELSKARNRVNTLGFGIATYYNVIHIQLNVLCKDSSACY